MTDDAEMIPFLNPTTWSTSDHEYRIYLDNNAHTWCIVDEIDYHYFVKWKWRVNTPHPTRNGNKKYAVRSQSNGRRYAPMLYLHVEIHKRRGIIMPSPLHRYVDHKDGDEFNCLRTNLRWATPSMNRVNLRR